VSSRSSNSLKNTSCVGAKTLGDFSKGLPHGFRRLGLRCVWSILSASVRQAPWPYVSAFVPYGFRRPSSVYPETCVGVEAPYRTPSRFYSTVLLATLSVSCEVIHRGCRQPGALGSRRGQDLCRPSAGTTQSLVSDLQCNARTQSDTSAKIPLLSNVKIFFCCSQLVYWSGQETSRLLRNQNVHYRLHKIPLLYPLLSQVNKTTLLQRSCVCLLLYRSGEGLPP
jgi:hypothetical protein